MQKLKLTRVTAIVIGVVISLVVIAGGLFTYFNIASRASNQAPSDVIISKITSQSATLSWVTGEETQGTIEYGTSPAELGFYAPEALEGTTHSVDLTLLTPNTTHYFIIRIGDNVYDNAGIPWSFTTKPVEAEAEATPAATLDELATTPTAVPTLVPGADTPVPTQRVSPSVTPRSSTVPTIRSSTPTNTPVPTKISCYSTNCEAIAGYLGPGKCSVQDYYKCLYKQVTPTATPLYSPTPSPTPTPGIDAPGNLNATVDSSTQITLTWLDRSTNESGFVIERATGTGSYTEIATVGANTTSYANTGLTSGTTYTYRVRAYITGPSYSPPSNEISKTTP